MGRRRRKSTSEGLFDVLSDLTDMFWQVGAIVSAFLVFLSLLSLDWVTEQYIRAPMSPFLVALTNSIGWMYFLIPLMFAGIAIVFGLKSYESYRKTQYY